MKIIDAERLIAFLETGIERRAKVQHPGTEPEYEIASWGMLHALEFVLEWVKENSVELESK